MKFAQFKSYIIYVEATYENIQTREQYTQEHYYGDLPQESMTMDIVIK